MQAMLIKLVRAGSATRPDTYSYCRIVGTGRQPLGAELRLDVRFPTPPCGAGLYAQIVCLQRVSTKYGSGFITLDGTFNATDIKQHCNVSPNWHPADGSGTVIGPVVRL
jgi:hypothetical protein